MIHASSIRSAVGVPLLCLTTGSCGPALIVAAISQGGDSSTQATNFLIASTSPAADAVNVSPDAPILVRFNLDIDPASVDQNTLHVTRAGGPTVFGHLAVSGGSMTFQPARPLALLQSYVVSIGSVRSTSGRALAPLADYHFTTANGHWRTPERLDAGHGGPLRTGPHVGSDGLGNLHLVWLGIDPASPSSLQAWRQYRAVGGSWTTPELLTSQSGPFAVPRVASSTTGPTICAWSQGAGTLRAAEADVATGVLLPAVSVANSSQSLASIVAAGSDSVQALVWRQPATQTGPILVSLKSGSLPWSQPLNLKVNSNYVTGAYRTCARNNGDIAVLWAEDSFSTTTTRYTSRVYARVFQASSMMWLSTQTLYSGGDRTHPIGNLAIAASESSGIAVWLDRHFNELRTSRMTGTTFATTPTQTIEPLRPGAVVGDGLDAGMDQSGSPVVVWSADESPGALEVSRAYSSTGFPLVTQEVTQQDPQLHLGQIDVAVASDGRAVTSLAYYDQVSNNPDVVQVARLSASQAWSDITSLDGATAYCAVSIDGDGRASAVYAKPVGTASEIRIIEFR